MGIHLDFSVLREELNAEKKIRLGHLSCLLLASCTGAGLRATHSAGNIDLGSPCQPQFISLTLYGCEQGGRLRAGSAGAEEKPPILGTLPPSITADRSAWPCFSSPLNDALEEDPSDSDSVGWMSASLALSN